MSRESEVLIEAAGLGKAYSLSADPRALVRQALFGHPADDESRFWAVRGVDLEIRRGESLGVVGRNGSGKSTLLQCIAGTVTPSAGSLRVEGRVAALLELGASFHPDFTGRENVQLTGALLGLGRREIAARFAAIEQFAGIGRYIDQPVRHYSSGMYARLAFAVHAHADPDILIVDEALSVGDGSFRQRCLRFFDAFRKRGALLFVSHDLGAVMRFCDRALWLDRGRPRRIGPSREVCEHYAALPARRTQEGGDGRNRGGRGNWRLPPPPPLEADFREASGARPRSRIEIFALDPEAPWHGHGGARIEDVGFYAAGTQNRLAEAAGGEEVELRIACRAERLVTQPIVGFILRDRLGQNVLGDNTYLAHEHAPVRVLPGQAFTGAFRFQLPWLAAGAYTLAPSIIEGTQEDHIHLHWIEEAVVLRVTASAVSRSVVGVPMTEIRMERAESA